MPRRNNYHRDGSVILSPFVRRGRREVTKIGASTHEAAKNIRTIQVSSLGLTTGAGAEDRGSLGTKPALHEVSIGRELHRHGTNQGVVLGLGVYCGRRRSGLQQAVVLTRVHLESIAFASITRRQRSNAIMSSTTTLESSPANITIHPWTVESWDRSLSPGNKSGCVRDGPCSP